MKYLGKIVKLKEYSERTKGLTVVPYRFRSDDQGDEWYEVIIVKGQTLGGMKVGDVWVLGPRSLGEGEIQEVQ